MIIDSIDTLLVHELKDLYSAEMQFRDALVSMAEAAANPDLERVFLDHKNETESQISRLEQIFDMLDQTPTGEFCEAAEGLVEEGEGIISDIPKGPVRDAALIGAAARVEHYEMAGYGTAIDLADKMGDSDISEILRKSLSEEGAAKKLLKRIAGEVNSEALVAS